MKKVLGLILGLSLYFLETTPVIAKVIIKEKGVVSLPSGEVINDDLFVAAESVDIDGTVNGDVYIGAGNVTFSGEVSGDLVIAAGNITIDRGVIGDSLIVGGGSVTIDDQSLINGSMLIGAGNIDNQAEVGRNFFAGAGSIRHNAPVGREARFGAGKLRLGPKTVINGDLIYGSEEELEQDRAAVVRGKITRHERSRWQRFDQPEMKQKLAQTWRAARLALSGLSFIGALVVGLALLWLSGRPMRAVSDKIENKFGASLGWGLVMLLVVPPALMLLLFTGIGAPLAFIGGLLFIIDLYLAKIFASLVLGKVIARQLGWKFKPAAVLLVGLAAYYLLRLIPFIGAFVCLVALLSGLGGLWLYQRSLLFKK